VPRFLHQKSAPTRLLAVLLFCALLPAIVLASYAIKGLLEADQVYQAGLRNQRELNITRLHNSLVKQATSFVASVGQTAGGICEEDQWRENAAPCAQAWLRQDARTNSLLIISSSGELLFPPESPGRGLESTGLLLLAQAESEVNKTGSSFHTRHLHSGSLQLVAGEGLLGGHRALVGIDLRLLREELMPSLSRFNRSHPGLSASIVRSDSPEPMFDEESLGTAVSRVALSPWLPDSSLQLKTLSSVLNPARGPRLWIQLFLLVVLVVIVALAVRVSTLTLRHEVRLARMKSDFVANVSHELRTPLTTIRIMAEMLALGAVPDAEKQSEYHRNIVSEAERLTRLINNVLDFARIEEGRKKFEFGMGDLGDVVFEVVRIIGDYARKEGFEITTSVEEGLPATSFDRDAIIQALINLTANAVKYSEDDKRIEVGARCERDSILLWVSDHGAGIDAEEVPHLFEKFFRGGEHLTREIGGTGLGLSIVHHIVQVHGGEVSARSTVGEGSTFEILLPIRHAELMSAKEQG